jgi:1-aminocyclopropane-1-carboxylate deaminase/D-cysteine desulfhydrase-like pyridoxal-dependent ACC family enzyme
MTTPVEFHNGVYVKRDDLFEVCGVRGGKARSAHHLIKYAMSAGFKHVVTAGSRFSPQVEIVGSICREYGLGFTAFVPAGVLSPDIESLNDISSIDQVPIGRNSVIKHHAQVFAYKNSAFLVPFGMECDEAVTQTASQLVDIPSDVKRIVIPVGSAMSLCGVLHGLTNENKQIPVVGISVGANPERVLRKYAPIGWESMCKIQKSPVDYHTEVYATIGNITLDPVYEAKCLPFLKSGDMLWVVGARKAISIKNQNIKLK